MVTPRLRLAAAHLRFAPPIASWGRLDALDKLEAMRREHDAAQAETRNVVVNLQKATAPQSRGCSMPS